MKMTRIVVAGLAIATLGLSANASAQEWGPPPPPPPPGWGGPPPPPPPPAPPPPPRWGGYYGGGYGWRDAGYGYRPYYRPHHRCWTEYRGWERVRICR